MASKKRKYAFNKEKHVNARKNQCPRGHDYDITNTYEYTDPNGVSRRYCRECRYALMRRYRARKKGTEVTASV